MNTNFENLSKQCLDAIAWVNDNKSAEVALDKISDDLLLKLARCSKATKTAFEVMPKRSTICVFGASQAGKSYLVSNMAAGENDVLETVWDNQKINFLTHVNPQGHDHEATGFVTRFTHDKATGIQNFPIEVRVFDEADIIMILINTFFNDFDQDKINISYDETFLKQHLENCKQYLNTNNEPCYLTFPDIVAIADYASSKSGGKLNFLQNTIFWKEAYTLAPKLTLEGRVTLFSILWDNTNTISIIYKKLATDALLLKGVDKIYAPLSAFLEDNNGKLMQRADGTIINVSLLDKLFDTSAMLDVTLDNEKHDVVSINIASLATLALEMTFPLEASSKIANFDILDFPGARERDKKDIISFKEATKDYDGKNVPAFVKTQGPALLRRGKVAYLFDRYTKREEIDVLLFCISVSSQSEVTSIVKIINNWIYSNIGSTPIERAQFSKVPFITVFSRFDSLFSRQLLNNENGTTRNTQDEMKNALERIKSEEWVLNWANGIPYQNYYFARKPNLSENDNWILRDADTKTSNGTILGKEIGIKEDKISEIEEIKAEFLQSELVQERISYAKAKLDAVLSKDGGVSLIIDNLATNFTNNKEHRDRFAKRVLALVNEIENTLSIFANLQGAEASKKAFENATNLALNFIQCDRVASIFTDFRSCLELNDSDLDDIYNNGYADGSNASRFANEVYTMWAKNLQDLSSDYRCEHICNVVAESFLDRKANLEHEDRAKEALSFFYDEGKDCFKDSKEIKTSVKALISQLVREIAKLATSSEINLKDKLQKALNADEEAGIRDIAYTQIKCAQLVLSDFNMQLCHAFLKDVTIKNVIIKNNNIFSINDNSDTLVFDAKAVSDNTKVLPKLSAYNKDFSFNFISSFFSSLIYAMANININAENTYKFSQESNEKLCNILNEIKINIEA